MSVFVFFFNDTATTEIYTLSLHDAFRSLMWGDYKDKVDELQMEMNKNEFEWEELKYNLNAQIKVLSASKARFSQLLSEARSNMTADRKSTRLKLQSHSDLVCRLLLEKKNNI